MFKFMYPSSHVENLQCSVDLLVILKDLKICLLFESID